MTYGITSLNVGATPIANIDTSARHPVGTIVKAADPTYGEGEFIYLKGVASTVIGSIVTYNTTDGQTVLAPAGTNIPQPIAVAMAATLATQYGWYQISGQALAFKSTGAMTAGTAVGVSTAGVLNATATGKEVFGATVITSATTADTAVLIQINRPHMQGRIT